MENKRGKQEEVDVILQKTTPVKTNEQNPKQWEKEHAANSRKQ